MCIPCVTGLTPVAVGATVQSIAAAPEQRLALLLDQRKTFFINIMSRD